MPIPILCFGKMAVLLQKHQRTDKVIYEGIILVMPKLHMWEVARVLHQEGLLQIKIITSRYLHTTGQEVLKII